MSSTINAIGQRVRRAVVLLLASLSLLTAAVGLAQDDVEREGYFEVRSASTTLGNGVHLLDSRLQLVLSSEALEALNSGVVLTIELQMQVIRARRFYMDALDAELAVSMLVIVTGAGCSFSRPPSR